MKNIWMLLKEQYKLYFKEKKQVVSDIIKKIKRAVTEARGSDSLSKQQICSYINVILLNHFNSSFISQGLVEAGKSRLFEKS